MNHMARNQCSFCEGVNEADSQFCVHCGNRLSEGGGDRPPTVLREGAFLRDFQIVRLVGEGGMGQVYEAVHPLTGARVAIKHMVPSLSDNDTVRLRFIEEARTMTLFNHPAVVPIQQFFVEDGRFFLVMKYIDGVTLEEVIDQGTRDGRPAAFQQIIDIGVPIAQALHHLHTLRTEQKVLDENGVSVTRRIRGVIHRDVKPSNILIERKSQDVYLTDFGVAKAIGRERMTKLGGVVGTYEFMSPEQVRGGTIGPASDQYSLAATLYNLSVGRVPFPQTTEGGYDVMDGHVRMAPPPPCQFRSDLPEGIQAVLLRALSKTPGDRFPDCRAFGDALGAALSDKAALLPTPRPPRTTGPLHRDPGVPTPAESRSGLGWMIGGIAAAGLALALILLVATGSKKDATQRSPAAVATKDWAPAKRASGEGGGEQRTAAVDAEAELRKLRQENQERELLAERARLQAERARLEAEKSEQERIAAEVQRAAAAARRKAAKEAAREEQARKEADARAAQKEMEARRARETLTYVEISRPPSEYEKRHYFEYAPGREAEFIWDNDDYSNAMGIQVRDKASQKILVDVEQDTCDPGNHHPTTYTLDLDGDGIIELLVGDANCYARDSRFWWWNLYKGDSNLSYRLVASRRFTHQREENDWGIEAVTPQVICSGACNLYINGGLFY